ncbi:hypothetical protein V5O48_001932 [Marasmius crinis-equi]|uniref:Uncharacterized protein n=1 Tax=Marasmius crinis-equi TaxID=585013 RepID=A0ABR3FX05_9AGAR
MLIAQGAELVDLTVASFETKPYPLSHRPDASLSRWRSPPRRSSSWETSSLVAVARPPSPSTLGEEFGRVKFEAESSSISATTHLDIKVLHSREDYLPSSYALKLHPDLQQLCEGDESDEDLSDDSELTADEPVTVVQISPSLSQDVASEGESTYSEWDGENENDVLQFLYSLKHSIVIESMSPHVAPHIVITPCEDTWDDQTIAWFNRVEVQSSNYLQVPPTDVSEQVLHPSHDHSIACDPALVLQPRLVFNRGQFETSINRSSVERLIMLKVVLVLRKQMLKAVAFEASQAALSFRQRYDMPVLFEKLEKPFRWTDPAESLLSHYRRYHGTTILESSSPFLTPHIVISAPPPENPWFKWSNEVNNPQDCDHGRRLVVPARGVEFINEPEDVFGGFGADTYEDFECYGDSFASTIESYRMFGTDDSEDDEVNSPGPETPTDEQEDDDFKSRFERALQLRFDQGLTAEPLEDEQAGPSYRDELASVDTGSLFNEFDAVERDDMCSDGFYSENAVEPLSLPICRPRPLASECENWSNLEDEDEDDEEGLPPLDEWYQSVIRRTSVDT